MPTTKKKKPAATKAKKTTAKKAPAKKKPVAKKTAAKKSATKKTATKKATAKKTTVKKTTAKKTAPKKAVEKKAAPKKPTAKKVAPKKLKKPEMSEALKKIMTEPIYQAEPLKSKKFTNEITKILQDEKNKILHEVAEQIRSESKESKKDIGDIYDVASDERQRELSLTLGDRERVKLQNVEDALYRIKEGIYGDCEECGEPIGEQRLRALPFTCVCVECKSKEERGISQRNTTEDFSGQAMLEKSEGDDF